MLTISWPTSRRLLCGQKKVSSTTNGIYASRANSDEKTLQRCTNNLRDGVALYKSASSNLIQKKWTDALNFYESFTHMDEVREAHDKVITIQSQLLEAQQRRSSLMIALTAVRKEQQMIQDELANCSRSADRYLGLVRLEIDASLKMLWFLARLYSNTLIYCRLGKLNKLKFWSSRMRIKTNVICSHI